MDDSLDRKAIADRLRLAREQAGLSQGQVALKMGLQRPSVSEVEAGRRRVSAEELGAFAEIYGVDASWLLKGTSDMPNAAVELAARELTKLKKEDLDTVLRLLKTIRSTGADK